MKRCSKCGAVKPLDEFNRETRSADGRRSNCKLCHRATSLAHHLKNREQRLAAGQAYYLANRDQLLARQKQYYLDHREERQEYERTARKRDPAARRAYERAYWAQHRDGARQKEHRWRARRNAASIVPIPVALLRGKWAYWGGMCWLGCGRVAESWDHVKPLSKGGLHCLANLRPACRACNSSKKDTWPLPQEEE